MRSAVEFINQNADIELLLNHYNFKQISKSGDMIRSCCAIHGGGNATAFAFNLVNNFWYCHTGCKRGGDIYDLIMEMEKVDFPNSVRIASEIFNIDISNMELRERSESWLKETRKFLEFIKKKMVCKDYREYDLTQHQLFPVKAFRHFTQETLQYFNLMYAKNINILSKKGDPIALQNRLVIPITHNNICVGMCLRKTKEKDYPKWSNQPANLDFGGLLYNLDNAIAFIRETKTQELYVVEGIFDVWKYHEIGYPNVVSTFGSHITESQKKLILKYAENVNLSFDNDSAGILATQKSIETLKQTCNLRVVSLPSEKDPEQCTNEELEEAINNKVYYYKWGN